MSPHPTAKTSHEHSSRANVTDVEVWIRRLEIQAVRDFFSLFSNDECHTLYNADGRITGDLKGIWK